MNDLGQVDVQKNAAGFEEVQQQKEVVHDAETHRRWVNGLHVDVDVFLSNNWSELAEVVAVHREGVEVAERGARTAGRKPGRIFRSVTEDVDLDEKTPQIMSCNRG